MTADADTLAFLKSLLGRYEALGIHNITFEQVRHTMRDSGVVKDGPETARFYKGKCHRALLLWDHHGSGLEKRYSPEKSATMVQERLDAVNWRDKSAAVVIVPELEEWLWRSPSSIVTYFNVQQSILDTWVAEYTTRKRMPREQTMQTLPKELFEHICINKLRQSISPRDFEELGKLASVMALQQSDSFSRILSLLREWFPA